MATSDVTRIAGNINALNALNSLNKINKELSIHQGRLASGKRINSAADDPAGLSIATKMLARSEGLKVAGDNIGDATNMLSVAEAGLSKMNDILIQMRSKAEQAASDTLGFTERQAIQTQLSSYAEQIDNIVSETKWNGVKMLDGAMGTKYFQTGVDKGEYTQWNMSQAHTANALGASASVSAGLTNDGGVATIGNGVQSGSPFTGLSELSTGSYQFAVLNAGNAAGNTGKIVSSTAVASTGGTATLALAAEGANAAWLNNGTNTLHITSYAANVLTYTINGNAGTATFAANNTPVTLSDTGLTLSLSAFATQTFAAQDVSIDYVKAGYAEAQLQAADGSAIMVDADGVTGGSVANSFYVQGGGANFNTGKGVSFDPGAMSDLNGAQGQIRTFTYTKASAHSVDVSTATKAADYMEVINTALNTVSASMADLGSLMARLDFKSDQVATAQVNVEASYNRIMNADMAAEQVQASKYSILQQTATAMLAQANSAPQFILSLFR